MELKYVEIIILNFKDNYYQASRYNVMYYHVQYTPYNNARNRARFEKIRYFKQNITKCVQYVECDLSGRKKDLAVLKCKICSYF